MGTLPEKVASELDCKKQVGCGKWGTPTCIGANGQLGSETKHKRTVHVAGGGVGLQRFMMGGLRGLSLFQ